jgi:hypothetical protein
MEEGAPEYSRQIQRMTWQFIQERAGERQPVLNLFPEGLVLLAELEMQPYRERGEI